MTPRQIPLSFDWEGLTLAGTLHAPPGPGPHPAVLMAQGSGPADRDSGGYFGPIRQVFLDRGVAVFSFDKPGCGESTGNWHDYALDARAAQLAAAVETVRNHTAISSDQVGIWGHSQGGWLVQKLAGRGEPLAFAIASSAPSISVHEQIGYEADQTLRHDGYEQSGIDEARSLTRALQQAAVSGVDFETVSTQLLGPASVQPWYASYPALVDAADWRHTSLLMSESHDPVADLEQVACPFLAVYGGLDVLLPAWQGAEESGRALAAAPCVDATLVVFPTGDHRMQHGDNSEFVDGYLTLLGDWVAARA